MAKILVVEDDEVLRRLVVRVAASAGHEAIGAADGVEAIGKAHSERPDLIVLDVSMPKLDGRDVLAELKHNPATATIPVVVHTGNAGEHARRLVLELGADEVVEKPVSAYTLFESINRVLRRGRPREKT